MGRLTKKIDNRYTPKGDIKLGAYGQCVQKLGKYEDLVKQGRLIEVIRCKDCRYEQHCGAAQYSGGSDGYCDKAKLKELE